jgi:hypothetical protein
MQSQVGLRKYAACVSYNDCILYYVPMNSRTFETKHISKTDTGPLWMLHTAIATFIVTRDCLYDLEVIRFHLRHCQYLCAELILESDDK